MRRRLLRVAAAVVVVAALAVTGAMSASAVIHDVVYIRFDPHWVELRAGTYVGATVGHPSPSVLEVENSGANPDGRFVLETDDSINAKLTISFEILLLGEPTGYKVQAETERRFNFDFSEFNAYYWTPYCSFTKYDQQDGQEREDRNAPFRCEHRMETDTIKYRVQLNRVAEAEGVLRTNGHISLTEGVYDFNTLPYRKVGSEAVAANSSTDFAVVNRPGDTSDEPGITRARFVYRIVDAGRETDYWVVGWSQVEAATLSWEHQAPCFVTNVEPRSDGFPPDSLKRDLVLPYQCLTTYEDTFDGKNTYRGEFEVQERPQATMG